MNFRLASFRLSLLAAMCLLIVTSCKRPSDDNPPVVDETLVFGKVSGTVYTENGNRPVPNAKVFIDDNGEIYLTRTDANGNYELEAPVGDRVLNIQTGDGDIFRTQANVRVSEGQNNNVPSGNTQLMQTAALAFIPGAFDEIETIIIDTLGYQAQMITVADLSNINVMNQFAAIFLNCGKSGSLDSAKYGNLYNYVMNGGSLYASDWAIEYLTGDGNFRFGGPHGGNPAGHDHTAFDIPSEDGNNKITACTGRVGGFISDNDLCSSKIGPTGFVPGCNVVAPDIQVVAGMDMDVEYDLGGWEVIQTLGPDWEVLVEDNSSTAFGPLAIRYAVNSNGSMIDPIFSGTNNGGNTGNGSGWVTICHIPPGNPGNPITITVSTNALQAHLNHGDQLGPCGGGTGANIYYTTFHNHPNSGISGDMKNILEYVILNL